MKSGIGISKVWSDDELLKLRLNVSDGESVFINQVYASLISIPQIIEEIKIFSKHIYGGIYDLKFGEFGNEYASGAFLARFHFHEPTKLCVSTYQQSEFEEFYRTEVASEARFYLRTEPVLIDEFIRSLVMFADGKTDEVFIKCLKHTETF